jgi:hypothetical protein
LPRSVGRGETQHRGVEAHLLGIIQHGLFAHQLGAVVDALRILGHILRHRLVRGRAVFAEDWAIDPLGAGVDHAANIERARRLEHVDGAHDIDLDAEGRIGGRHSPYEPSCMYDVRHPMPLDDVEKPRPIEDIARFEIDLVDDVEDQPVIPVARIDHRPVSLAHELTARLGTDDTHATGDQHFHGRSSRTTRLVINS